MAPDAPIKQQEQPSTIPMSSKDLKTGMRLRIWWGDDTTWYAGRVMSISRSRGICVAFDKVEGEDDRTEYYSREELDAEEWELICAPAAAPPASAPPQSAAATPQATATAPTDTMTGVLCIICFENEIAMMFQPCGHVCCCSECVDRCEQNSEERLCPICRQWYDPAKTTIARLAGSH